MALFPLVRQDSQSTFSHQSTADPYASGRPLFCTRFRLQDFHVEAPVLQPKGAWVPVLQRAFTDTPLTQLAPLALDPPEHVYA
jgi:hypothetical protein